MLLANPTMVAHSFDEGIQPYSTEVFNTLSLYFGERFVLHRGNSHALLPVAPLETLSSPSPASLPASHAVPSVVLLVVAPPPVPLAPAPTRGA